MQKVPGSKCAIPTTHGLLKFGILKFPVYLASLDQENWTLAHSGFRGLFSFPQIVWDFFTLSTSDVTFFPLPQK